MHNLYNSFLQFADQIRKRSEMIQTEQTSPIRINAYVSGHLWDMLYDSKIQLVLILILADKVAEKVP